MRITFLGTSHGIPECNHRCSCTMLEVVGRYYLFDLGVMVVEDLVNRGIDIGLVKAAFITHPHGDHCNGLVSFCDLLSWYYKTAEPEIFIPTLRLVDGLNGWLTATSTTPRELSYREVKDGEIFNDGVISVSAINNNHCENSFSYIIRAEGKTILLAGDLCRTPEKDLPRILPEGKVDFMVSEAAHFNAEAYKELLKGRDIATLYINHLAPWNALHTAALAKNMPEIPVRLATDGLEVTL